MEATKDDALALPPPKSSLTADDRRLVTVLLTFAQMKAKTP